MHFNTKVIHAGVHPDPETGAIMTPIYQTSTYVQKRPGEHKGYEYSRTHNPTRTQLQNALASIENGKFGLAFASGMAAIDTVMKLLKPGQKVVANNDLYGGTYRLFTKVFATYGIDFQFIDMSNAREVEQHIDEKTSLVWMETPTNPLIKIIDIKHVSEVAKQHKAISVVDNTFASPYLQNPLELGADVVMHSATKYIAGHSDVVMGALVTNDHQLNDELAFYQNSSGAVPGPMDAFLTLRGIKTLSVRMQRHSENGKKIAHFLQQNSKVSKVHWPGFENHRNHKIAAEQMSDFGGMISFELTNNSIEHAHQVISRTKIFTLAESLGGVESLIGHPASMTHASIPREKRLETGLTDSLIRLSVGIEYEMDLIKDLEQAIG